MLRSIDALASAKLVYAAPGGEMVWRHRRTLGSPCVYCKEHVYKGFVSGKPRDGDSLDDASRIISWKGLEYYILTQHNVLERYVSSGGKKLDTKSAFKSFQAIGCSMNDLFASEMLQLSLIKGELNTNLTHP